MTNKLKLSYYKLGALVTGAAFAFAAEPAAASTFSNVATNITTSLAGIPGILSAVCYIMGIVLTILGIAKIKEHVEKPEQTPLKEGTVRLIIGGAFFALPYLMAIVANTVQGGDTDSNDVQATLKSVQAGLD